MGTKGPRMAMQRLSRAPSLPEVPTEQPDFGSELMEDLEIACLDAMRGDAYGTVLASRLQLVCMDLLQRRGIEGVRVRAQSDRRGTSVQILLPQPDKTVRELVLTMGPDDRSKM